MRIFISGISGTGMGPLALMAKKAGIEVCGSDVARGPIYEELKEAGIDVYIGEQDGKFLRSRIAAGKVDWFVHTSALPAGHREMAIARLAGLKISKRDELILYLSRKLGLKMVAVAGTHGKTTTTAMIIWACRRLNLPIAYFVGTTLGFAPSGDYQIGSKFLVFEADEYDRNFLAFSPWLAVITSVSYDHPDVYATREEYVAAFRQFEEQSYKVVSEPEMVDFRLAGEARRYDAGMAREAMKLMRPGVEVKEILDLFPGVGRRFERIFEGVYSDYAHHPEEIKATLNVAMDECRERGYKGVIVVYQPHQNARQHEVREGYKEAFSGFSGDSGVPGLKKVYWLPTYLVREDSDLPVLAPEELFEGIPEAEAAEMDDELFEELMRWRDEGYMILLMTAGPADEWLRKKCEERLL